MDAKNDTFISRLDAVAADTEALLDRLLSPEPAEGELSRPTRLIEAMRYSSLNGGKRLYVVQKDNEHERPNEISKTRN